MQWSLPPRVIAATGVPRRIGIELEFANLGADRSAELVRSRFGGALRRESDFLIFVEGTEFGDFRVELDLQLLRRPESAIAQLAAELTSAVLPMEIVCPPIPLEQAHLVDCLVGDLRKEGALGTLANPVYALGAQLNPELPTHEVGYVLSVLRAYVLLSDWLRAEVNVDLTRKLTFFAAKFPDDWCRLVLHPSYRPSQENLIDDYLAHNPTRYRELDMLPFFKHLEPDKVARAVPDQKIHTRPTYHYRLPNALVEDPDWGLGLEWSRWLAVERLAERQDLLEAYGAKWLHEKSKILPGDWTAQTLNLLHQLG